MLAEMVVAAPKDRPVQRPAKAAQNEKVKVKAEPAEAKVGPAPSEASVSKPIAMSIVDFSLVLSLVFGGCCSNVWTYEYLLRIESRIGTALTFSQMAFVTIQSLPRFLIFDGPYHLPQLRPRHIPLSQWAMQVLVLTAGSLLNNWAFAYHVPLTVQIVFRSAGLAVSMLFGVLFLKKKYTPAQIVSVLFVTVGVILATLSTPSQAQDTHAHVDLTEYTLGIIMLTASLLMTGVLGMLQERTYTRYGPHWQEGLFYTHALSLPIYIFFIPGIKFGFSSLHGASLSSHNPSSGYARLPGLQHLPPWLKTFAPYIMLAVNLITQLVCVSGVNQLTSRVSSVSTNLVLTTRKALSLCFSVWWFGNGWNGQLGAGAAMVFLGSLLYTAITSRMSAQKAPQKSVSDARMANSKGKGKMANAGGNEHANQNGVADVPKVKEEPQSPKWRAKGKEKAQTNGKPRTAGQRHKRE